MAVNEIRDLREKKGLSQDAVAAAAGITYSVFVRIEAGSGRTKPEEVAHVLKTIKGMKATGKRVVGRPFGDAKVQAAAQAARELGTSVAAAVATDAAPAPAKKATPAPAPAPAKKATPTKRVGTPRKRTSKPKG